MQKKRLSADKMYVDPFNWNDWIGKHVDVHRTYTLKCILSESKQHLDKIKWLVSKIQIECLNYRMQTDSGLKRARYVAPQIKFIFVSFIHCNTTHNLVTFFPMLLLLLLFLKTIKQTNKQIKTTHRHTRIEEKKENEYRKLKEPF